MPAFADHPMLSGIYEPVVDERQDAALEVSGEIPAGLRGTFYVNPDTDYDYGGYVSDRGGSDGAAAEKMSSGAR